MSLFEPVPQCDFVHLRLALHRVFVDGIAYHAETHQECAYAYTQRHRMLRVIVKSESSERFIYVGNPDVVFGVVWDVPAFYMYSHKLDMLWVYGSFERVVQYVLAKSEGDKVALVQRARKLLVTRELAFAQACVCLQKAM